MKMRIILLPLSVVGCGEPATWHIQNLPSEVTVACAADVYTEVPEAELPFDLAAVAARSGTHAATGEWAYGGITEVAVALAVRTDAAWRVTPEDPTCGGGDRWEVDVTLTASSDDGYLTHTWQDRAGADTSTTWSLGVVFDAQTAADLREAAGYPATSDPYAALSLVWDTGVSGEVKTHADDGDTGDSDAPVLDFQ